VKKASAVSNGKVISQPGGQGIRKVKVTLRRIAGGNGSNYEAVTDESGLVKLDSLPDGSYSLQLERAGYAVDRKTNPGKVIKLAPGESKNDLVFQMLPAGVITGKIVNADGDPLRNVSVVAVAAGGMDPRRRGGINSGSASTNDLGEYRIPDYLLPGKYFVEANPPGRALLLPVQIQSTHPKKAPFTLRRISPERWTGNRHPLSLSLRAKRPWRISVCYWPMLIA
jgi:hypothetical protein